MTSIKIRFDEESTKFDQKNFNRTKYKDYFDQGRLN